MQIEFLNVPTGTEWWDEALYALKWAGTKIAGIDKEPEIVTRNVPDSQSRVHVMVVCSGGELNLEDRQALVRTLIAFLEIHHLQKCADVFFAGFGKPDVFTNT